MNLDININIVFYAIVVLFGLFVVIYIGYNWFALSQIYKFAYKGDKTQLVMIVYIAIIFAIIAAAFAYIISVI